MSKKNRGGKSIALGLLERGGRLRISVVEDRERPTLQGHIRNHVEAGTEIVTDELHSYWGLEKDFVHQIVNHAVEYVSGHVPTNGLENFWSLVKGSGLPMQRSPDRWRGHASGKRRQLRGPLRKGYRRVVFRLVSETDSRPEPEGRKES